MMQNKTNYALRKTLMGALVIASALTLLVSVAQADYLSEAKEAVAGYTGSQTKWTGPTSGVKAEPGKHVVYISCGAFNEICVGVGKAVDEAGKQIGWKITTIDGKGGAGGWLAAWNQALALKPDGIIAFTSADAVQRFLNRGKVVFEIRGTDITVPRLTEAVVGGSRIEDRLKFSGHAGSYRR